MNVFTYIDIERVKRDLSLFKKEWNQKKPFRYLFFDDFLFADKAEVLLGEYPSVDEDVWGKTTYINQKNKFQKNKFIKDSIIDNVFKELNHPVFLTLLSEITGIDNLIADKDLFGGGLHQSTNGAFLDVHVDYNIHPETKLHRMLNVLLYMNKNWKTSYEGHLELWDMGAGEILEKIAPQFNRLAMFETNQISYHGHPHPLNTPKGVTRKSLATYYYAEKRLEESNVAEHNTKYVNTTGARGKVKNFKSGVKAFFERFK